MQGELRGRQYELTDNRTALLQPVHGLLHRPLQSGRRRINPVRHIEADPQSSEPETKNEWLDSLTERELEMLRYLSQGLTYKEIASAMHYSEGTVKNYVSIIYSKLNVKNRMQAVNKYQEGAADQ